MASTSSGALGQDLRFAYRNLKRTPAFPLAAIGTLALGIGATTAIFTAVNAVLLRPLPYPHADDLYSVRTTLTDGRPTTGLVSPIEIARLREAPSSIAAVAGVNPQPVTLLRNDGVPMKTIAYASSEGFFDVFGVPLALGSVPAAAGPNTPPVAVMSYRIWRDFFGSDPAIVGKPVRFVETSVTIAGVAPKEFETPRDADFWFTIGLDPQGQNHSFDGFMRLKPGTGVERARSEMAAVMAGVARDFPVSAKARAYVVRPLVESIVGDLGSILVVVLSATALLLLLACVNVTNLLLARGAARAREMALRLALGASRGRIIRQLLTESALLATAGALVGLLAAELGLKALLAIGASKLPRLDAVPLDGRVLLFALGVLVISGILVGFAPALRLAATDVKTLMNDASRSASAGRGTSRWLGAMTVAEIALAVTLVAGAGWLIRGFANLQAIEKGFTPDGRLLFDLQLTGERYRDGAATGVALRDLMDRIRGQGGVVAVGATNSFPLRGAQENSLILQLHGEVNDPAHPKNTRQRFIEPGFFAVMGTPILAGRDCQPSDRATVPPAVLVNRTFAERHLKGQDPLTTRFASGYPTIDPANEVAVIGVVEDIRQRAVNTPGEPAYYTCDGAGPPRRQTIIVHTRLGDTAGLQASIRQAVHEMDPQMPVDFEFAPEIVATTLRRQQLGMTLMLIFGGVAVALAAIGIYGVIAYATAQRRSEIATRLALGAPPSSVFWLVLRQGRTLTLTGAVMGLLVAFLSGKVIANQLYEVSASDPMILGAAAAIVVAISLVATLVPAIRAMRTEPSGVLRV